MTNTVTSITADFEAGGWEAEGVVFNDADALDFYQEVKVWFDFYAGGWRDGPLPAFSGHLLPDKWRREVQGSKAPWSAFTAQEFLKRGELQGIFFKDEATPANDHQINGMTFASIVSHLLGQTGETGHCNLVAELYDEGILALDIDAANSAGVSEYEIKQGNFWSTLKSIANAEFYALYVDKANTLHYIPHPMFGTTPDTVVNLDSGWLLEPLQITRRNAASIGQMILHGTTPGGDQITGKYPTNPAQGPIVQRGGYMIDSSTDLDAIAQRMYLWETRQYTVEAQVGNGMGLLVELLDRVTITYSSSQDGISWSDEPFYIHKIAVDIGENMTARTAFTLEQENTGGP